MQSLPQCPQSGLPLQDHFSSITILTWTLSWKTSIVTVQCVSLQCHHQVVCQFATWAQLYQLEVYCVLGDFNKDHKSLLPVSPLSGLPFQHHLLSIYTNLKNSGPKYLNSDHAVSPPVSPLCGCHFIIIFPVSLYQLLSSVLETWTMSI